MKAVFTTAGTLGPVGIRGWLLGELPEPIKVRGDESAIRKYVLGCAGHDGYTAVVIKNVATRVVCANTLGVALGERGGASWRIQHTASAKERLEEAGKAFARIAQVLRDLRRARERDGHDPVHRQADAGHHRRHPARPPGRQGPPPAARGAREGTSASTRPPSASRSSAARPGARSRAWTEYADHHRALRDTGRQDPKRARLESIWMGRGAAMKQAALTAIAGQTGIQLAAA